MKNYLVFVLFLFLASPVQAQTWNYSGTARLSYSEDGSGLPQSTIAKGNGLSRSINARVRLSKRNNFFSIKDDGVYGTCRKTKDLFDCNGTASLIRNNSETCFFSVNWLLTPFRKTGVNYKATVHMLCQGGYSLDYIYIGSLPASR